MERENAQAWQQIAAGRTAELFAWGEGRVLKRYRPGFAADEMTREVERTRQAQRCLGEAAVRVPLVWETGNYAGRPGIVFERIHGPTMLHCLFVEPERAESFGEQLAVLHLAMHRCSTGEMPSYKARLHRDIVEAPLPEALRDWSLVRLDTLPDADRVCHGDLHPDNVILTADGPVIIDWVNSGSGPPLADVARTVLLMLTAEGDQLPAIPPFALTSIRKRFTRGYLAAYWAHSPFDEDILRLWIAIVACARFSEQPSSRETRRLRRVLHSLMC